MFNERAEFLKEWYTAYKDQVENDHNIMYVNEEEILEGVAYEIRKAERNWRNDDR